MDGLVLEVQNGLKLGPFEKALFVFCNKQQNRIKILNFDEGFGY
ncbi:IS66 family insertion sequence element accessory protein TnpB [Terrisporobacter petrolearius]